MKQLVEKFVSCSIILKELIMELFDIDEKKQVLYHRAIVELGYGFVDPRKYSYLDRALFVFAGNHHCSYDEALILAKIGKRTGRLANE